MNAKGSRFKSIDVAIVSVLIDTEHPALLATFGLDPFSGPQKRIDNLKFWFVKLETRESRRLNIVLTCFGNKGNVRSYGCTKDILRIAQPKSTYLVGTAAGRKDRASICDVVVSSEGIMYYESGRPLPGGGGSKPKYVSTNQSIGNEVRSFYTSRMKYLGWEDEYKSILHDYEKYNKSLPLPGSAPSVHFDAIASGEKFLDEKILGSICKQNDSVRAGEMEGYGFAHACDESGIQWLVIRGISDFGDRREREKWKITASVMACSFLKVFLENAFQRPKQIKTLAKESLYVREKIPDIMRKILKENSIDITPIKFSLDLTISELVCMCHTLYPNIPLQRLTEIVRMARATAFEKKYADRTQKDDERFMDIERWKAEFKNLLFHLDIRDLTTLRVINVGIGNGLEAKELFGNINSLMGVDISKKALEYAKQRCPQMQGIMNDAEDLHDVANSCQDVYISLRTYQSTLFDIRAALLEAYRVLRPGGLIFISIPYVFISEGNRMVKGLLLPESDQVDPDLPYVLVDKVRRWLSLLNFDRIGIRTGMVEVYVYGQRGR